MKKSGRKRILIYGQLPPPHIGSNIMTRFFMDALKNNGYETILSQKQLSRDILEINRIQPVKIWRLAATLARFCLNLLRVRPDVTVFFTASTIIGLVADSFAVNFCRLCRVPYVLYFHTDVHRRLPTAAFPLRQVLVGFLRSAKACLVQGNRFREEMMSLRSGPVFALPNCLEALSASPRKSETDGRVKILFLSLIAEAKGILTLLASIPHLAADDEMVTVSIVGPWQNAKIEEKVKSFVKRHDLDGNVTFLGEAYGERKMHILGEHDIFVLPSRRETMSLAVLESMRSGLPVVTTNVGVMSEAVVEGKTGFLVPLDDPISFADRILALYHDPALRARMGNAGRERFCREFTFSTYERNLGKIMSEVLGKEASL